MITSSSLFKRMRWFTVLLLFAFSLPEEAQTSNIPDMIKIKADCFTMGSEEFVVEEPEHKVCLNSYYLMVHEVTQKQFESAMGNNPSRFKGPSAGGKCLVSGSGCLLPILRRSTSHRSGMGIFSTCGFYRRFCLCLASWQFARQYETRRTKKSQLFGASRYEWQCLGMGWRLVPRRLL